MVSTIGGWTLASSRRGGGWGRGRLAPLTLVGLLGLLPALAQAAPAQEERAVALPPVEFIGELPEQTQDEVEAALERALERLGAEVVLIDGCLGTGTKSARCWLRKTSAAGLPYLVRVSIKIDDRDYEVALALIASSDGGVIVETKEQCEVCGVAKVIDSVEAQVTSLESALDRMEERPRLRIDGDPPGATIILDGEVLGSAPMSLEVAPGPHQLELRAPGRAARNHSWKANLGVEEVITYELGEGEALPSGRKLQIAGALGLGLGVGGVGAGVALLVLDGQNHGPTCGEALLDANGACPNLYTTGTAGAVSLGLGAAALIAGAAMLIVSNRQKKRQQDPLALRLRPQLDGVVVRF